MKIVQMRKGDHLVIGGAIVRLRDKRDRRGGHCITLAVEAPAEVSVTHHKVTPSIEPMESYRLRTP